MYKLYFIIISLIPLCSTAAQVFNPLVTNVAKAAPIILATHMAADTISTFNHEVGHGLAGYALAKAPFKNYFYWADNPLKLLLFPLAGSSRSHFTEPLSDTESLAHIAAGPIAGLGTTYTQVIALETLRSYLDTGNISIISSMKRPFTFYKDMSELVTNFVWAMRNLKTLNTNTIAFHTIVLNGIMFMRLSRMAGEIAYGLLPTEDSISIDGFSDYKGDGLNLWETMYRKFGIEDGPKIKGNLFVLATIPAAIACLHGLAQGLLTKPTTLSN